MHSWRVWVLARTELDTAVFHCLFPLEAQAALDSLDNGIVCVTISYGRSTRIP
jgi:hypothetical protein